MGLTEAVLGGGSRIEGMLTAATYSGTCRRPPLSQSGTWTQRTCVSSSAAGTISARCA